MRLSLSPVFTLLLLFRRGGSAFYSVRPAFQNPVFGRSLGQHQGYPASNSNVLMEAVDESKDSYDDWYADFNPADFEDSSRPSPSRERSSFGGRGRGGGGASHDYERDLTADRSSVDETAVNQLIADRLRARKTGSYDEADAIRDDLLRNFGVAVFDKERVWRTGVSESGSGRKWRPEPRERDADPRRGGRDFNSRRPSSGRGRDSNSRGRRQTDFGPNGHDYDLVPMAGPNTSPLAEPDIHRLLAERLESKLNRDFSTADAIQQELVEAGVFVHDGLKLWRADGEGFGDLPSKGGRPGRERGSRSDRNAPYEQSQNSLPTDNVDVIQSLIFERAEAKKTRNFDLADDIREELRTDYNVEVDDRLRQWSVGGEFDLSQGGLLTRGARSPYCIAPDSDIPDDAESIQLLVEQREEARKNRDFDMADSILDDLKRQNVVVDDRRRMWVFTVRSSSTSDSNSLFVKRGRAGDLSDADEALINTLLAERDEAKREKAFGKADRIRDRLQDEFQVRVDDRAREWHVVSQSYVMNPESDLDDEVKAQIEARISERAVAKLDKDYDKADDIRDELAEVYNVIVDDRLREWKIEGLPASLNGDYAYDTDMLVDIDNMERSDDDDGDDDESFSMKSSANSYSTDELTSLTVPELKERLRAAGLPVSGKKAELIERLAST